MDNVPFTSPISPIGDQRSGDNRFARRLARRRVGQGDQDEAEDLAPHDATPPVAAGLASQPLLEALDRLRVTRELRPVELEYTTMLRGLQAYQDPTTRIINRASEPTTPTEQSEPQADAR